MVKTEAIGMDIMKFGSALAVIRYNTCFQGIQHLFPVIEIEIEIPNHIKETFDKMDASLVRRVKKAL